MGRIQKVTDELSPEAKRVMADGFASARPALAICEAVLAATGEVVTPRTMSRRAAEWRAEQERRTEAREQFDALIGAAQKNNLAADEVVKALALQQLVDNPYALDGADPVRVQRMHLVAEELQLKKRRVELQARAIAVDERRMEMLEQRESRARAQVEELAEKSARGEQISAEDVQRIRDIYGLAPVAAGSADAR